MEESITGGQGKWTSLDPDKGQDQIERIRLNNQLLKWGPTHTQEGVPTHRMVEMNARMNVIRMMVYAGEDTITVWYVARTQIWTAQVDKAGTDTWEWVGETPLPEDFLPGRGAEEAHL